MVWGYEGALWVAHTLQQIDGFSVGAEKEVGEAREQDKASSSREWNQWDIESKDCEEGRLTLAQHRAG